MRRVSDCGPVAISNYLEAISLPKQAGELYDIIMARGFPESDGLSADLWDSPPRHFDVVEAVAGRRPGLVDDPFVRPCVVLLRFGWAVWHWITVLNIGPSGEAAWHDGHGVRMTEGREFVLGGRRGVVVLAYALGSSKPLPWYWDLWRRVTYAIVGG